MTLKRRTPMPRPSKPMERGKPLNPGTKGLTRTPFRSGATPLPRSALPCTEKPAAAAKVPAQRKAGPVPMPKELAAFVLERSGWACDWCGRSIIGQQFSRQHRRARGGGGRAGGDMHTAANVIVLCGSATSPGCHNRAENQERALAYDLGFAIKGEARRPEDVPMFRHGQEWVIPTDQGFVAVPAPVS